MIKSFPCVQAVVADQTIDTNLLDISTSRLRIFYFTIARTRLFIVLMMISACAFCYLNCTIRKHCLKSHHPTTVCETLSPKKLAHWPSASRINSSNLASRRADNCNIQKQQMTPFSPNKNDILFVQCIVLIVEPEQHPSSVTIGEDRPLA